MFECECSVKVAERDGLLPAEHRSGVKVAERDGLTLPADHRSSVKVAELDGLLPAEHRSSVKVAERDGLLPAERRSSVKVAERDGLLPAEHRSPDTPDSQQCTNETMFARLKLERETAAMADMLEERARHLNSKPKPSISKGDSFMFMSSVRNTGTSCHDQRQPFAFRIHANASTSSSQSLVSS